MGTLRLETDGSIAGTDHSGAGDHGGRDHRATHAWLSPLRTWAVLHRSVWDSAVPVLDDLRSGFLHSHPGEPEVSRAFRDGALFCKHARATRNGPATFSLPLRTVSSLHLFRHERLRTVRRCSVLVPSLLGHCRHRARNDHEHSVGTWHGGKPAGTPRSCGHPFQSANRRWLVGLCRSSYRGRWIHLLQHQHPESLFYDLRRSEE